MANSIEILKMLHARYTSITKTPNFCKKKGNVTATSSNEVMKNWNISEDTNKVCRICLSEGSVFIFGIISSENIPEALANILGIQVSIHDSYPKYLCQPCHVLLQGASLFRKIAQQSERQLKKIEIKLDSDTNESFTNLDNYIESQNKIIDQGMRYYKQLEVPKKENLQDMSESDSDNYNEAVSENDGRKLTINKQLLKPKVEPEIDEFVKQREEIPECTECMLNFNTYTEYIEHKLLHTAKIHLASHKTEATSKMNRHKEKIVRCRRCDLIFKSHKECNDHKKTTEHRNKKQTCAICSKTYGIRYIKKHMLIHQSNIASVCEICGKNFKSIIELNNHSVTHFDVLLFKCSFCPYKGRRSSDLKMHIRSHTGEKPYQCDQCPQRFISKSNLNRHMKFHTVQRDFKCEECNKEYYSKLDLDNHFKAVHVGIKEHMCQYCNKAYSSRKHMMRHQRKVHNREKLRSGRMPIYLKIESMKKQEETT